MVIWCVCSRRARPCVVSLVAAAEPDLSANAVESKAAAGPDFVEIDDIIEDISDCDTLVQVSEEHVAATGTKDDMNLLESKLAVQIISDDKNSSRVSDADVQAAALIVETQQ
jgi:hypothetical protein